MSVYWYELSDMNGIGAHSHYTIEALLRRSHTVSANQLHWLSSIRHQHKTREAGLHSITMLYEHRMHEIEAGAAEESHSCSSLVYQE